MLPTALGSRDVVEVVLKSSHLFLAQCHTLFEPAAKSSHVAEINHPIAVKCRPSLADAAPMGCGTSSPDSHMPILPTGVQQQKPAYSIA